MFSHIFVGADDVAVSKKFYDAVLGVVGVPEGKIDPRGRVFYRTPTGTFGISKPIDGKVLLAELQKLRRRLLPYVTDTSAYVARAANQGKKILFEGAHGTIGFACDSPEKVKAFHDAGVASGGKSIEDPPGWREDRAARLYLAYLRDPFGNKICALHRVG